METFLLQGCLVWHYDIVEKMEIVFMSLLWDLNKLNT